MEDCGDNLLKSDLIVKTKSNYLIEIILFITTLIFFTTTIIFLCLYIQEKNKDDKIDQENKNDYKPSENQYIPILYDFKDEEGANILRGKTDIQNSKYYKQIDIYNTKSSGSLILLEKFKTYQQTSRYTCGCASLIMVLNYLDGKIISELDCANKAKSNNINGTFPENLEKAITEYGYDYESKRKGFNEDEIPSYDEYKFAEYIQESLKNREPIIIESNDWGGHYTVIIGYDDMGTDCFEDDVVIIADPFDCSDHISDGYTIWSYERLYSQMELEILGFADNNYEFIKVKRKTNNS